MLICGSVWVIRITRSITLPSEEHPLCFYSDQTRDDLRRLFLQALKSARESIDLSIYALTDADFLSLLQKKRQEVVLVRIHYDAKATSLPPALQQECITLPHRKKSLMHRKLLIIDHKLILLGSANLTTASLTMHDNLVVGIYHQELGRQLEARLPLSHFTLSDQAGKVWLLPESRSNALESLLEELQKAKKKICLAQFTLTHPALVEGLLSARSRGVIVLCVLDHYTAEGASRHALESLKEGGVSLFVSKGQQLFHHKWVCIDDKILFTGSANWTKAAFSKNSDLLLALHPLNKEQRKYMRKIWKTIKSDSERKI